MLDGAYFGKRILEGEFHIHHISGIPRGVNKIFAVINGMIACLLGTTFVGRLMKWHGCWPAQYLVYSTALTITLILAFPPCTTRRTKKCETLGGVSEGKLWAVVKAHTNEIQKLVTDFYAIMISIIIGYINISIIVPITDQSYHSHHHFRCCYHVDLSCYLASSAYTCINHCSNEFNHTYHRINEYIDTCSPHMRSMGTCV